MEQSEAWPSEAPATLGFEGLLELLAEAHRREIGQLRTENEVLREELGSGPRRGAGGAEGGRRWPAEDQVERPPPARLPPSRGDRDVPEASADPAAPALEHKLGPHGPWGPSHANCVVSLPASGHRAAEDEAPRGTQAPFPAQPQAEDGEAPTTGGPASGSSMETPFAEDRRNSDLAESMEGGRPTRFFSMSSDGRSLPDAVIRTPSRIFRWSVSGSNRLLEAKGISFAMLCAQRFPDRQWEELNLQEQVSLVRMALEQRSFLISPHHKFMKVWDLVICVGLIFVGVVTPYEVVFLDATHWGLFYVNRALDLVFLIDIIIQFFLQVEVQRSSRGGTFLLRDPVAIRHKYLTSWFLIDVVSLLPVDILSVVLTSTPHLLQQAKLVRCLKLLKIAKLLRIVRSSRIVQRWKNMLAMQFATQKLISFFLVLIAVSHWMACAWGFVGLTFGAELCNDRGELADFGGGGIDTHEVSWVTTLYVGGKTSPDHPCNHFEVYVASLHWAVMTLTSIGYGDIVPVRLEEYIVCIICMLLGGVLWAYVIGSLCSIISSSRPVETNFETNTDLLNSAMHEAGVPLKERPKYREFLREAKAYDRRVSFGAVADTFSPMLRRQLLYHVTKEAINSVYYFRFPDAPRTFLMDVASCLVPRFFSRGESLDCLRFSLCMVDRGTVAHGGRILTPPNVFHEDFIITLRRFQRTTRTVALTFTQILVLSRESLDTLLEKHPAFMKTIRRCALKTAFCRAVRITIMAYNRTVAETAPPCSFSKAFDHACLDGDTAVQVPLRKHDSVTRLSSDSPLMKHDF